MIASVAAMVPAAAGVFALAAIVVSWMRYGHLALSLRDELADCETTREMRYVLVTTRVLCADGDAAQPGFMPLAARPVQYQPIHRQARRSSMRAAA